MSLRAIRGAIQVEANTSDAIESGVKELLPAILDANGLKPEQVDRKSTRLNSSHE